MSLINDGGPAFPISLHGLGDNGASGMTLRDHFAGLAMNGVIASCTNGQEVTPSLAAPWCYEMADAMLKAREKGAGS